MRRKFIIFTVFLLLSYSFFARDVKIGYYEMPLFTEGASKDAEKYGYAYEYIEIIAKRAGWNVEYVYGTWPVLYEKLLNGKIDLMPGLSKTDDRIDKILFPEYKMGTESYYLYKRSDDDSILKNDIYSISYKKVGILEKTLIVDLFFKWAETRHINCQLLTFSSQEELCQNLSNGTIDLICGTDSSIVKRKDYSSLFSIGSTDFYLAASKESAAVLRELNQALAKLNHTYPNLTSRLKDKYFSESIVNLSYINREETERKKILGFIQENISFFIHILITLAIISIISIIIYFLIKNREKEKNIKNENELKMQLEIYKAMSGIYYTSHLINLKDDSYIPIIDNEVIATYDVEHKASKTAQLILSKFVKEEYLESIMNFIDFTNLPDRMQNKKVIYSEFIGNINGHCRISFITVKYDINKRPTEVLFNVELLEKSTL